MKLDKNKTILSIFVVGLVLSFVVIVSAVNLSVGQTFTQNALDNVDVDSITYSDLEPKIVTAGTGKINGILIVGVVTSHLDFEADGDNYVIVEKLEAIPLMTYVDYKQCIVDEGSKANCINNVLKPNIVSRVKNSMDATKVRAKTYQDQSITTGFDEGDLSIGAGDF